jgi:preprotein translocase subunit SecG
MQGLLTGLLTVLLVADCILLVLLVLLQLPKKEAGAGLAFGGTATDALFGAGSGNVLTRITKYVATAFFVLAIALALVAKPSKSGASLSEKLSANKTAPVSAPASAPSTGSNDLLKTLPAGSNAPVSAPSTNK